MKTRKQIIAFLTLFVLVVSAALCYGAAGDYKVTNDGGVHAAYFTGPVIDARSRGAKGDGLEDDTTNLGLAATDAAGKTLFVPHGMTFLITSVTIAANTRVTGGGTLKQKVLDVDDGSPIINVTGNNVTIDGIKFDGQKGSQPADGFADAFDGGAGGLGRAYRAAIKMDSDEAAGWEGLTVQNCYFHDIYGAGVATDGVSKVRIENNVSEDCYFELGFIYDIHSIGLTDCHATGNRVKNTGTSTAISGSAFLISNCVGGSVSNNIVNTIDRGLVKLENPTSFDVVGNVAQNVSVLDGWAGIQLQSVSLDVNIIGNVIKRTSTGITITGTFALSSATGITIAGNTIDTVDSATIADGIIIDIPNHHLTIAGNVIRNADRNGMTVTVADNLTIMGNIIDTVAFFGLNFDPIEDIDQLNIVGNTVTNAALPVYLSKITGTHDYSNLSIRGNTFGNDGVAPTNGIYNLVDCITSGIIEGNTLMAGAVITIAGTGCKVGNNFLNGAVAGTLLFNYTMYGPYADNAEAILDGRVEGELYYTSGGTYPGTVMRVFTPVP